MILKKQTFDEGILQNVQQVAGRDACADISGFTNQKLTSLISEPGKLRTYSGIGPVNEVLYSAYCNLVFFGRTHGGKLLGQIVKRNVGFFNAGDYRFTTITPSLVTPDSWKVILPDLPETPSGPDSSALSWVFDWLTPCLMTAINARRTASGVAAYNFIGSITFNVLQTAFNGIDQTKFINEETESFYTAGQLQASNILEMIESLKLLKIYMGSSTTHTVYNDSITIDQYESDEQSGLIPYKSSDNISPSDYIQITGINSDYQTTYKGVVRTGNVTGLNILSKTGESEFSLTCRDAKAQSFVRYPPMGFSSGRLRADELGSISLVTSYLNSYYNSMISARNAQIGFGAWQPYIGYMVVMAWRNSIGYYYAQVSGSTDQVRVTGLANNTQYTVNFTMRSYPAIFTGGPVQYVDCQIDTPEYVTASYVRTSNGSGQIVFSCQETHHSIAKPINYESIISTPNRGVYIISILNEVTISDGTVDRKLILTYKPSTELNDCIYKIDESMINA